MSVIRPFNPPVVTPQQPGHAPARPRGTAEAKAAQRAFFQQALGDATPVRIAPQVAPTAPVQASAPAQSASAVQGVVRPIPQEPPARMMRPGSFVDIKV